jgi:hypothetical protein
MLRLEFAAETEREAAVCGHMTRLSTPYATHRLVAVDCFGISSYPEVFELNLKRIGIKISKDLGGRASGCDLRMITAVFCVNSSSIRSRIAHHIICNPYPSAIFLLARRTPLLILIPVLVPNGIAFGTRIRVTASAGQVVMEPRPSISLQYILHPIFCPVAFRLFATIRLFYVQNYMPIAFG